MRLNDRLSLSDPNEAGPRHHLTSQHVPGEKGCHRSYLVGVWGVLAQDQPLILGEFFDGTSDGARGVNIKVGKQCLKASFPECRGCFLISFISKSAEECYKTMWLEIL